MFGGLFLAGLGAFWIFMVYGFATMMDPAIQGAAREAAIWRKVSSEPTSWFAVILVIVGGWLMFHVPKRTA